MKTSEALTFFSLETDLVTIVLNLSLDSILAIISSKAINTHFLRLTILL